MAALKLMAFRLSLCGVRKLPGGDLEISTKRVRRVGRIRPGLKRTKLHWILSRKSRLGPRMPARIALESQTRFHRMATRALNSIVKHPPSRSIN